MLLLIIKLPFVIFYEDELGYRKNGFAARDFNTVFVGSSRTKRSVIPAYFDSLTSAETDSYNFGIGAALPPYTIDECEELIRHKSSLKYVFFELSGEGYGFVPEEPWKSFSYRKYSEVLKNLPASDFAMFHNILALNIVKPKMSPSSSDYNLPLENVFKTGGFNSQAKLSSEKIEMLRRHNLQIEQEKTDSRFPLNENYWKRILRLIELAESKKIKIYFFIPPRLQSEQEVETVHPVYHKLEEKYKLGVNHYDEFFYREEGSLDDFHLNFAGAKLFTEKISEAFKNHNF